jgi:hypothetical protein
MEAGLRRGQIPTWVYVSGHGSKKVYIIIYLISFFFVINLLFCNCFFLSSFVNLVVLYIFIVTILL